MLLSANRSARREGTPIGDAGSRGAGAIQAANNCRAAFRIYPLRGRAPCAALGAAATGVGASAAHRRAARTTPPRTATSRLVAISTYVAGSGATSPRTSTATAALTCLSGRRGCPTGRSGRATGTDGWGGSPRLHLALVRVATPPIVPTCDRGYGTGTSLKGAAALTAAGARRC